MCFGVVAALTLLFSVSLCAAADSERAAGGWNVEQLMQRLAQVKTASGKFVERKELAILTTPLESSGTLLYTAPGRLEKHTLRPKPESLILDEKTLTIEDKSRNRRRTLTLEEHPVIWAFVESIRATLAGDLKSLNRFYKVSLQGARKPLAAHARAARSEHEGRGGRDRDQRQRQSSDRCRNP